MLTVLINCAHLFMPFEPEPGDSMSPQPALDFRPYREYEDSERRVHDFTQLTKVAYGLSQLLLFANPQSALPPLPLSTLPIQPAKASYCNADMELVCEWVLLEEYARREGLDMNLVNQRVASGKLGPVKVDDDGSNFVIWPPKTALRPESDLPELGKKKFAFEVSMPFGLDVEDSAHSENNQRVFLHLAHSIGEPKQASARSEQMLFRSGYLLQWTVFEVFLRETVIDFMRRHPQKLGSGKRAKQTITYEALIEKSSHLQSLDNLANYLVDIELESMRAGGRSVHGIINFLKDEFRFSNDPYQAWYRFNGEMRTASYQALMSVKRKRNALVHESNLDLDESQSRDENQVHEITEGDYDEARLILRSIAFSIAESAATGEYRSA
jgi:hypothetical protein